MTPGRVARPAAATLGLLARLAALAPLGPLAALAACGQLVRYTDELADTGSGRSWVVTTPAHIGGFIGFAAGIPVDVVALPITFTVYRIQHDQNAATADPLSTMLFPSFVLWRLGTLIAVPIDLIEFAAVRAWAEPRGPTEAEQNAIELELDEDTLPTYPVETIYPRVSPPPASRLR